MTVLKDIVANYGAPTDGTSSADTAFANFKTDAIAVGTTPVILTCPPLVFKVPSSGDIFKGIQNLIVHGYGATLDGVYNLGSQAGVYHDNLHSARVATVLSGASSVTLLDPLKAALFSPGDWAMMGGYDNQGSWNAPGGYPPNLEWFEYVQILSVVGLVVRFTASLKYTYKSTWPNYNSGRDGESDAGGPATLYALDPAWNCVHAYRGLSLAKSDQLASYGREINFVDVTTSATCGLFPSHNMLWQAINCKLQGTGTFGRMEVDKLISKMVLRGTTVASAHFQNSAPDICIVDNSNVVFSGTPRAMYAKNSALALDVGSTSWGKTDWLYHDTCSITTFSSVARLEKGAADAGVNLATGWSMANGIIRIPNNNLDSDWRFIPGSFCHWAGSQASETGFQVLGVTQDATNIYVQTDQTGGFPTVPLTSGKLFVQVHPAPRFTCVNCTGSVDAVDLSQAAPGAPLNSYTKRSYTGNSPVPGVAIEGKVVSVKINVTTPYTGATGTVQVAIVVATTSLGAAALWQPLINARSPGLRTITPSGVTGTQGGDSALTLPDPNVWLSSYGSVVTGSIFNPNISAEAAGGWAVVEIEIKTDQGITPQVVAVCNFG